jgi:hypothetical protein
MRLLTIDIETLPHEGWVWGLRDQNIALNQLKKPGVIASFAAKFHGERKVYHADIHDGEKAMLRQAHELLGESDAVIGYNSQRFDVRWFKGQFIKHRMQPIKPIKHIDLLKTVRSEFYLPSYKLEYVAGFFGVGAKLPTGGFDLWKSFMENCPKARAKMKRYNIGDVRVTEAVYDVLIPWIKNHPNIGVFEGRQCCPKCGGERVQSRGQYVTRDKAYPQFQCRACFTWLYQVAGKLQEGVQRLRAAA